MIRHYHLFHNSDIAGAHSLGFHQFLIKNRTDSRMLHIRCANTLYNPGITDQPRKIRDTRIFLYRKHIDMRLSVIIEECPLVMLSTRRACRAVIICLVFQIANMILRAPPISGEVKAPRMGRLYSGGLRPWIQIGFAIRKQPLQTCYPRER